MKKLKVFFCLFLFFSTLVMGFHQQPDGEILPNDFTAKVFAHIVNLAEMDHRHVGSENDRRTVEYINDQFKKMHIDVDIQPFEFEAFEYTNVLFEFAGEQFDIVGLGIIPHTKKRKYKGKATLVDLNNSESRHTMEEIEGKTIISNDLKRHFGLARYKPGLIIYVDSLVFQKLKSFKAPHFNLHFDGEYKKFQSANVIGKVVGNKSSSKEVLITAHHDTFGKNNPGASDNASGVGVLLELARYFMKIKDDLPYPVKFVAFAGEEVGFLGSRIYIHKNSESLQQCELVFNIDNVGGNRSIYLEMTGGVNGISRKKGVSQIPKNLIYCSWEGINSISRPLLDEGVSRLFSASNHPQWLVDIVNQSVKELGYDINPTQTMGSDALMFAQAGIVSSGVGIRSQHSHTANDTPEEINKKNLKIAGEIAAHVVLKTLDLLSARKD